MSSEDLGKPVGASIEGGGEEGDVDFPEGVERVGGEEVSEGGFRMEVGESDLLDGDGMEGEELEEIREEGGTEGRGLVSGELGGEFGDDERGRSRSREGVSGRELESGSLLSQLGGEDF